MADEAGAQRDRLLDVHRQLEGRVLAVLQLDDAGDADEVDPLAEVEIADDRRAREDQDGEVGVVADQRMRERATAAQVTQAEGIVAIDEDAPVTDGHLRRRPSRSSGADYGIRGGAPERE